MLADEGQRFLHRPCDDFMYTLDKQWRQGRKVLL